MWFIKTHETVNCNSTLRQQCFLSSFSLLNFCHAQVSQIWHRWVGCCSCLAGLSSPVFLRIEGLWREFLFGCGSTFVVNAESSPFPLLCFCYAQLCHDWVGCCRFGILGLHFIVYWMSGAATSLHTYLPSPWVSLQHWKSCYCLLGD
jgi:hypothetical protein